MLNENELLESVARELGVIMINCRRAEMERDKLADLTLELQNILESKEEEREKLLVRLKTAEDARTELGNQIRDKNKINR